MALTAEQLAQIEYDIAARAVDRRMEAVRIARDVLMENDRNKPVEDRGVEAADIIAFAKSLQEYIIQ